MELLTILETGAEGPVVEVTDFIFNQKFNESLVHQVVTAYLAAARSGSKAQKTRAEVQGGGAKPWKQKGTGRARAGSSRSPIWRGGGVTFAAKPRSYKQKINKKMYRAAVCSILSELVRQKRLLICENFAVNSHKTRDLLARLERLNLHNGSLLIVCKEVDKDLYLAANNLHFVNVCDFAGVDPVSLINYDKLIMTVPVIRGFEEVLG